MTIERRLLRLVPVLLLVLGLVLTSRTSVALAAVTSNFQLDGNITSGTVTTPPDWDQFFNSSGVAQPLPAGFVASAFQRDFVLGKSSDSTTFTTGSKDTLNINPGWQCAASNNVGDKVDLLNTYAAAYRQSTGDLYTYVGAERASNSGDADLGVWLLQDNSVSCNTATGTTTFTGTHRDGDLLMTTGFSSGGSIPTVQIFRWNGGATGSLGSTPIATSGAAGSNADCSVVPSTAVGCGIVNGSPLTPPWQTQPKGCTPTATTNCALPANQFFEGGYDVTQAVQAAGGTVPCFSNILVDTRSSTSPTATIFDYTLHSFPTCGSASVTKYIDVNANGSLDTGEPAGAGWAFTVSGPNPSTASVCSGTTNSSGSLICTTGSLSNLAPGTYTVTETQTSDYVNTDPGPLPGATGSTTKSLTVTLGGTNTVAFGNTCYIAKTFQVTGVPTTTASGKPSSISAWYVIKAGSLGATSATADAPEADVALVDGGGGTWSVTVNNAFIYTSHIDWGFFINGNPADKVTVQSNEAIGDSNSQYPTCAKTDTAAYPSMTLAGTKYKDINGNGSKDSGESGTNMANFHFQLMNSGAQVGSDALSDSTGSYEFSAVPPGSYTVHEVGVFGWTQTQPASNGDQSVIVSLLAAWNYTHPGGTVPSPAVIDPFGNTPLSHIAVTFTSDATYPGTTNHATQGTMSCHNSLNLNEIGSTTGNTYTSGSVQIKESQLTCTVTITDP